MEGIILIILSLIISQFFGNKKKETQQTPPPVRQKTTTSTPADQKRPSVLKELETWSKQMLEETEQKMSPQTKEVVQKVERQARERFPEQAEWVDRGRERLERNAETVIEQTAVTNSRTPERLGRLSLHQQQKTKEIVMEEPVKQLVNSREELAQAIVLSEVLAPPISKRR